MEFELDDMEIVENHSIKGTISTPKHSLVFDELQKELENHQQRLKLNQKRLLLFEAENQKLVEEKNKLFFEMKNLQEKFELSQERTHELEVVCEGLTKESAFVKEKLSTLTKVNETQQIDLKRFSKFHLKIQNIIKPYIENLKNKLSQTESELNNLKKSHLVLQEAKGNLETKLELNSTNHESQILSLEANKNQMIQSYEEQIHSFSKEIIEQQQKQEDMHLEINRLKKAVEFKNYYENEVIKFKRIHEDDQKKISDIEIELQKVKIQFTDLQEKSISMEEDYKKSKTSLEEKDQVLESTRNQLGRQIEQNSILLERLERLEKLNLHLSQQM